MQALEITVWRDGMEYKQKYARGKPLTDLSCHVLPPDSEDRQGTSVRFWPDKEGTFGAVYLCYVSLCIDLVTQ